MQQRRTTQIPDSPQVELTDQCWTRERGDSLGEQGNGDCSRNRAAADVHGDVDLVAVEIDRSGRGLDPQVEPRTAARGLQHAQRAVEVGAQHLAGMLERAIDVGIGRQVQDPLRLPVEDRRRRVGAGHIGRDDAIEAVLDRGEVAQRMPDRAHHRARPHERRHGGPVREEPLGEVRAEEPVGPRHQHPPAPPRLRAVVHGGHGSTGRRRPNIRRGRDRSPGAGGRGRETDAG